MSVPHTKIIHPLSKSFWNYIVAESPIKDFLNDEAFSFLIFNLNIYYFFLLYIQARKSRAEKAKGEKETNKVCFALCDFSQKTLFFLSANACLCKLF